MIIFLKVIIIFLSALLILSFILGPIDKILGTKFSCKIFSWHDGNGINEGITFDGCSVHATCSKCGKSVMQDGQGNWF